MPVGKFPVDRFARPLEDGTPQSIVLREYGTNGTTEVLVETSLGRLLLNTRVPRRLPVRRPRRCRSATSPRSSASSSSRYDKAVVADSLDR